MNTKKFRTILIIGSLLSTAMLWLTRSEWQNSLSAFASSDNAQWYNLMHVLAMAFWLLNAAAFNRAHKKSWIFNDRITIRHANLDIITGLGMGMILVTNMYLVYTWHVIFTVSTFAVALFNLIFTAPKKDLVFRWVLASLAIVSFVTGYFTSFHFLVGEVLAMALIGVGMLRQIWRYD